MKRPVIGKVLVLCAALSLPALAAAAGGAATAYEVNNARVIVKYRDGGALMRENALAARTGETLRVSHAARMSQRLGLAMRDGATIAPRTQVLHASGLSSVQLVARLRSDPEVEYAEIDARVKRAAAPNDPLYPGGQPVNVTPTVGQWYLRPPSGSVVSAINAEAAWDVTAGSPNVIIAILDTGVRPDHPDLSSKLLPGYDFVTADSDGSFATANDGNGPDADPSDPGDWVTPTEANTPNGPLEGCSPDNSSWHGTQTAALVGASTNDSIGMAGTGRNVRVLPVRVLGKCGGFLSDVIAGIRWAAGLSSVPVVNPNPAKVLNLSLGSTGSCAGTLYESAVAEVTNAGVAVVVSAGNDVGQAVGKPANCPGAIGVGGLRHIGTKVGFSDVGPEVALSAPGGNCVNQSGQCLFPILTATNAGSTSPSGNTYTDGINFSVGTSFSSPLVAGAAGLMLSLNPTLTPAQLRVGLQRTSRAFPTSGAGPIPACRAPDATEQDECYCTTSTCGAGMLDIAGAVNAANELRAWILPSATQTTSGASVVLDGSKSWASPSGTITSRLWGIRSGPASLQSISGATTTLNALGAGTVVVRLTVADGSAQSFDDVTITVAEANSGGGGGGGSLSWPWVLALCIAVAMLRPRRSL